MLRKTLAATIVAATTLVFAPQTGGASTFNGVDCAPQGCTGPADAVQCWVPAQAGWRPGTNTEPWYVDWVATKVRVRGWDGRYEILMISDAAHCPEILPGVRVALEDVSHVKAYLARVADELPETLDRGAWEALARCEAGGDWHADTGNGHYGGLQFALSSWQAVGGVGLPSDASAVEQVERARALLDLQGPGAWPVCSRVVWG